MGEWRQVRWKKEEKHLLRKLTATALKHKTTKKREGDPESKRSLARVPSFLLWFYHVPMLPTIQNTKQSEHHNARVRLFQRKKNRSKDCGALKKKWVYKYIVIAYRYGICKTTFYTSHKFV